MFDFKYFLFIFLIVGVGFVGCVFVNRFLEDLEFFVFFIEVGGFEDDNFNISIFIVFGMF